MSTKRILSLVVLASVVFLFLTLTSGILALVFFSLHFEQIAELLTGLLIFFGTTWGLLVVSIIYLLACDRLGCCTDIQKPCNQQPDSEQSACPTGSKEVSETLPKEPFHS